MTTGHTYGEALRVLKDNLEISRASDPAKLIGYETRPDESRIIVTQPTDGRPAENWTPTADDLNANDWRIHS